MNNEIKIQSSKANNKVEISNNFVQYFEQLAKKHADDAKESELLAKDWANKLGLTVDDTEYSSKHYALKSKEEHDGAVTDIATAKTELEQSIATGLEDYNTNAQTKSDSLQTQFDSAITDIKNQQTKSVNAVKTAQSTAETSITNLQSEAISNIEAIKTSAETSIADLQANAETVISNGIADITANKEQSMSVINENRETSLAEIESAKSGAVSSINTTKDNAVSTVKQTGTDEYNKILSTGIDSKLGENLITNCLKEIPQRIKYTLVDGVLTILKGSVCIVPYGTEDKTADLPKGATFINENFRVYNTQYTEDSEGKGKFFVWAELVNDRNFADTIWTAGTFIVSMCLNNSNKLGGRLQSSQHASGDGSNIGMHDLYYNTTQNNVKIYYNNAVEESDCSLPMFICTVDTTGITSIDQVFNGMGVIGSTIWIDKGVKGLAANGKEIITDKLTFTTITDTVTRNRNININENGVWTNADMFTYYQSTPPDIDKLNYQLWFKEDEKIVYEHLINSDKWTVLEDIYLQAGICGWDSSSKRITSFTPKFPFRVTDYNDIDGKWVRQSLKIINGDTAFPLGSQQYRDYDISNYLPNDGHIYELAVEILAFSGSSTNALSHWWVADTLGVYQACSCGGRAYSNTRDQQYANGIIPMASRTLRLYCSSTGTAPAIQMLRLCGYRKVR